MNSVFSYFMAGTLAITCSWLLSGCRIGNNVETKKTAEQEYDGAYALREDASTYCTYIKSDQDPDLEDETCNRSTSYKAHPFIASNFTNPMRVLSSGRANEILLLRKDQDAGFAVQFTPANGNYTYSQRLSDFSFGHKDCLLFGYMSMRGLLNNKVAVISDGGDRLTGKVDQSIDFSWEFRGDCTSAMTWAKQCYQDSSKCGYKTPEDNQEAQQTMHFVFKRWVDAGTLSTQDFENLRELRFITEYR